jgi:hypothetical protein
MQDQVLRKTVLSIPNSAHIQELPVLTAWFAGAHWAGSLTSADFKTQDAWQANT